MSVCKSYYPLFIINLALICLTNAKVLSVGGCPADKKPIEDFDASKYMGTWYEYEAYPFNINGFNFGGKCIAITHSKTSNSSVFTTINSQNSLGKSKRSNLYGTNTLFEGQNIGKYSITFDGDSKGKSLLGNYIVLGTDYSSYTVLYLCNDYFILHTTGAWVLTRDKMPSKETISEAQKVIDANNISDSWFMKIDQSNCPSDTDED